MAFGVDYNEASEGKGLIPVGDYEVIIKYAGEDVTKNGTVYINVTCVIRNDVDQQYKNKNLWHSLYRRKEPTAADLSVGGYSIRQIQTLAKAAGLLNGKKYESLADWCDDLKDKTFLATIKHEEFPSGSGKIRANIAFVNPSKFQDCKHIWKKKIDVEGEEPSSGNANTSDFEDVTGGGDDLPF